MFKLNFVTQDEENVTPSISSVGLHKWILQTGEYAFLLIRTRKKLSLQVLKAPQNTRKYLRIMVQEKILMGVVKNNGKTFFEYPSSEPVKVPLKSKSIASARPCLTRENVGGITIKQIPRRSRWKPPKSVDEIVEKTFVINPDNPFLSYYATTGRVSFRFISEQHMTHLPHCGWNVRWISQGQMIKWRMAFPAPIGILHPTLYPWFLGRGSTEHLNILKQKHDKVVGFDVADSDAISKQAISFANNVDLLMVPSECSKKAYVTSGLDTNIEVVPHGLSQMFSEPKTSFHNRFDVPQIPQDGVNILFFELHSPLRKGSDVVLKAMTKILAERKNVNFVVRTTRNAKLRNLPRTISFTEHISDGDLLRLYDSCHILLAPSRGGGFEMNPLEGLARGLVVITSDWPAIQEYAEPYVLTIRSTGKKVKMLPGNPVHIGKGVDPDPEDAYRLLNYAIDNLSMLKKKAERLAPEIRKQYNWRNIAQRIANVLGA